MAEKKKSNQTGKTSRHKVNHNITNAKSHADKKDGSCVYAKKCGGCDYQGISYGQQLEMKQKNLKKLLSAFGKVGPIVGMKDPYHYRHKVHATFDCTKKGQIVSGTYKEGTHEVVDIVSCQIEDEQADAIIQDIKGLLRFAAGL